MTELVAPEQIGVADRAERRLDGVFDATPTGLLLLDNDGDILRVNRVLGDMLERPVDSFVGIHGTDLLHPDDFVRVMDQVLMLWRTPSWRTVLHTRLLMGSGEFMAVRLSAVSFAIGDGGIDVVMHVEDLREGQARLNNVLGAAQLDPVTGLPTRDVVLRRLTAALVDCEEARVVGVLVVDLDRFQSVNDRLGHAAGDQVLYLIGQRLKSVPGVSEVSRVGADEFLVVAPDLDDAEDCQRLGRQVQDRLAVPLTMEGQELDTLCTVGVSMGSNGDTGAELLARRAGIALHRAREQGLGVLLVDASDAAESVDRLERETELIATLRRGELELAYQPLRYVESGGVVGMEALLRWPGTDDSPAPLIELAERTGLINELGRWVLATAIGAIRDLSESAGTDLRINVNLSARQIHDPGLIDYIRDVLARNGVSPTRLVIELTETAAMADRAQTVAFLGELRAMGVSVAIDDFGTGYSSFAAIRDLPIDEIKIDRSFTAAAEHDPAARKILDGMVQMCAGLGLTVTAEGVERPDQLRMLHENGCERWQGYLSAHPARLAAVQKDLREQREQTPHHGVESLAAHAARLGLPDVLVFRRVGEGRYAHIGGVGRGEGWAGIVEIDMSAHDSLAANLAGDGATGLADKASMHVIGPYYARTAILNHDADTIVVLGNQQQVVEHPAPHEIGILVGRARSEITMIAPAKPLADELEVLEAVRGLLQFSGTGLRDALHHLLETIVGSLSCDVGLAYRSDTGVISIGIDERDTGPLIADLTGRLTDEPMCVQRVDDGLSGLPNVRSYYLMPLETADGFVFVAHTDAGPRGFTSLCQRLGRTLVGAALVLFDSALSRQQLSEEAVQSAREARTDSLTGIGNRLEWQEALAARPIDAVASALILDINQFKQLNDTQGHDAGDTVLSMVGGLLSSVVAGRGCVARVGGDEFGALLVGVDQDGCEDILEALHAAIESHQIDVPVPFSVAIGGATARPWHDIHKAVTLADTRMYRDKRRSRGSLAR